MAKKKPLAYIDQDTTDEFMDKPPIRTTDGRTIAQVEAERQAAADRGEIKIPRLPPPVDH